MVEGERDWSSGLAIRPSTSLTIDERPLSFGPGHELPGEKENNEGPRLGWRRGLVREAPHFGHMRLQHLQPLDLMTSFNVLMLVLSISTGIMHRLTSLWFSNNPDLNCEYRSDDPCDPAELEELP